MNIILFAGIILSLLIVVEIILRVFFGFGNPLIYIKDDKIGYLLAPNQSTRRFGNYIEINQYSMRNGQITATPVNQTLRILLLGDSIANGGWWTDQSQILSQLIEKRLRLFLEKSNFKEVEVLNASANSWSPRNQLSYLQKYGTFGAEYMILLINTDDLFGIAPTSVPIGKDINYPEHKPLLGIIEFLHRLLPYKPPKEMEIVYAEKGDRVGFVLEAIGQIHQIALTNKCKLLLAMTPLVREVIPPGSLDYEIVARKRLTDFTMKHDIKYIDFLPMFQENKEREKLFRDNIHLSLTGNELVETEIVKYVVGTNYEIY
ncbi:MAG TPA: SGNH/GDSL hydrolase family protein [Allocoleopsis sp.]